LTKGADTAEKVTVCQASQTQWYPTGSWLINIHCRCISPVKDEWSKFLRRTRHKVGHFEDILPSQSFGSVLKKTKPNKTNNRIPK